MSPAVTAHREKHNALVASRRAALRAALQTLCPSGTRIVWEVGSGHGHFLTDFAAANPKLTCIGVDIAGDRVGRSNLKRERAGLPNLHFLRADAFDFLDSLPAGVRFSHVIALFPDPWPKARHNKHRLIQTPFLAAIAPRMAPGARLYFRTDHSPYFLAAKEAVEASPGWLLLDEPWPFEPNTVFQQRAPTYHSLVAAVRQRDL